MFIKISLDENGFYQGTVRSWCETPEGVDLPEGMDIENLSHLSYLDHGEWKSLDKAPSEYHVIDRVNKVWFDPRTLDQIKDHKWIEIKQQREATEYGGFLFEGYFYDSDMTSQARIANASDLGVAMDWTTQDNQVVFLSAEQLKALKMALAQHIALCHEKGRLARKLISESETLEQIASVTY